MLKLGKTTIQYLYYTVFDDKILPHIETTITIEIMMEACIKAFLKTRLVSFLKKSNSPTLFWDDLDIVLNLLWQTNVILRKNASVHQIYHNVDQLKNIGQTAIKKKLIKELDI